MLLRRSVEDTDSVRLGAGILMVGARKAPSPVNMTLADMSMSPGPSEDELIAWPVVVASESMDS